MFTRKTSAFYVVLIAVASMAVGMVIASRLDLAPASAAQTVKVPPADSAPLSGPIDAATFRNIAKITGPAVVNIQTEVRQRGRDMSEYFGGGGGGDDLLRRFFGGDEPQPQAPRGRNRGGQGGQGRQQDEMPHRPLTEVKWGDSDQIQPGDWVMAIGNPFRLGHSVSVGVISGLGRPFGGLPQREQPMLQTDAAINPGNSGGPLLNVRGEVIGMNTAIYTDTRSSNIGIGFATPINALRDLLPQLRNGKIVRGVIGVSVNRDRLTDETAKAFGLPNTAGALISTVNPNGPADKASVQPGDVVVEFNGKPVKDSDGLVAMVVNTKPGSTVPVVIYRNNQRKTLNITVDQLDLDAEQSRGARRGGGMPNQNEPQPTTTSFGMTLDPITPDLARRLDLPSNAGGAIVSDVERNSPAANVIQPGDVILEINRQKVANVSQVTRELQKVQPGQPAFVLLWREGSNVFVTMTKR